jgi:hypothetical protein
MIDLVKYPVITEKTYLSLYKNRQYTFDIDKRLTNLETVEVNENDATELEDMTEEYENRFDILAQEISELKQTVLSLQTYTMEVNKMLFDEKMAKQISFDL